jgi:hypothetical protein
MIDRVGINGFAQIGRMIRSALMEGDDPNQLAAKPRRAQGKPLMKPFRYAAAFEIILLNRGGGSAGGWNGSTKAISSMGKRLRPIAIMFCGGFPCEYLQR